MSNGSKDFDNSAQWHLLVGAARLGAESVGYELDRIPGRGLSNVWNMSKDDQVMATAIRTTRDRSIAFPPLENGKKWKTLDDVASVLVAAVDNKENPENVEVYLFDASEVRKRFKDAYSARTKDGHHIRDNFGMWVALDLDKRGIPASVGSGLAEKQKPIGVFSIKSLLESGIIGDVSEIDSEAAAENDHSKPAPSFADEAPLTIAEAKRRLARTLGVDPVCIRITVEA